MDQPNKDDNTNTDSTVPEQPQVEQPTQINVTVASQGEVVDAVTPPMSPVASPEVPVATESPSAEVMLETAEQNVLDAEPQSSADELAIVESEIGSFVPDANPASPAIDGASQPSVTEGNGGVDPMQQIISQDEEPTQASVNTEQVAEAPVAEPQTEPMQETAVEHPIETQADANMEVSVEPNDSTEASSVAPVAIDTIQVGSHPESPMVNDVIAPSVVAAATAAGSVGENAITGTPEPSTVESSQMAPLANQMSQQPAKHKSGKGKLILLVTLVTLLFAGAAVAAYIMSSSDNKTSKDESQQTENVGTESDNTPVVPAVEIVAKALDDYKTICADGGLVSNATAYSGASPHPVVLFEKGSDDKFAQSLVSFKDKTWAADPAKVTSGQLVTCIARKADTEVKLKTCPITDSATKVTANVDFYSSKYTVDVYEAKTGKKLTTFENSSVSTICPTSATYSKADPKIFAGFDLVALETSLKDTVTKTL